MKRKILILLVALLPLLSLSAYSDSWQKYDSLDWRALFSAIRNNRGSSEVESLYSVYMKSSLTSVEKARAEYNMVRYYMDNGNEEKAKEHYALQGKNAAECTGDDVLSRIAQAEVTASDYYITKDMFTGMENSKHTKKLYEDFPDEVYIVLMNAWRLIYTPQIAGGSNKNAIKILTPLLDETSSMCEENVYSLYGALATAYYNRHDYEESGEYLDKALRIYSGESALLELREKLDKK